MRIFLSSKPLSRIFQSDALSLRVSNKRNELGEKGLTLVELIAVILLVGVLMGVVAKNIFGNSDAAMAQANVLKMNQIKSSLQTYKLQFNKYPDSLNCLIKACSEAQGKLFTPLADEKDLQDVWGTAFNYKTENGGRSFMIQTLGEDGKAGGEGAASDVTVK